MRAGIRSSRPLLVATTEGSGLDTRHGHASTNLRSGRLRLRQKRLLHFRMKKREGRQLLRGRFDKIPRTKAHVDPRNLRRAGLHELRFDAQFSCFRDAPGREVFTAHTVSELCFLLQNQDAHATSGHRRGARRRA